ncbi:CgeB family protein [Tepidibacter mesophilus]|uniref:CgeB family protein n=1 Tax=Tepidibacter mesophilus TaxID=655607 RepID=UPI000C06EE17|nr:glycosyltransferase [Tepidibacter mesophilus]
MKKLKIACILDEFSYKCFSYESNFINLKAYNWKEILREYSPDFLFVESVWLGADESWKGKIVTDYGRFNKAFFKTLVRRHKKRELRKLVYWCKKHNIPTVFWNKEDPVHFDKFIDSAKLFDYVFTTDADMIQRYKKELSHDRVYCLPFAAQPKMHNPIKLDFDRKNKLCFAGAYYQSHEERKKDMKEILDIAVDYGIDIYDRFHNLDTRNKFPDKYKPCIVGNINYDDIHLAYKGYKGLINLNTVKKSPTMFSRRVFEVLVSGTPVISNYAKGIKDLLGNDIVLMGKNKEEHEKNIQRILSDEEYWNEISVKGVRKVLSEHTYRHRLLYILQKIGYEIEEEKPTVSIVAYANKVDEVKKSIEFFNDQVFENKELNIIVSSKALKEDLRNKNIKFFEEEEINEIDIKDYIGYVNVNSNYDEHYLVDLILSLYYTDAKVIGKSKDIQYSYVHQLNTHLCIIKKEVLCGLSNKEILDTLKYGYISSIDFDPKIKLFSVNK